MLGFVEVTMWSIPGTKAINQSGKGSQRMLGGYVVIKKEVPFEGFSRLLVHSNIWRSAIWLLIKDSRYESPKQGCWWSLPLQFISLSNRTEECVNFPGKNTSPSLPIWQPLGGWTGLAFFMRCLAAWMFNFILLFYVLGADAQRSLDNCLFFNKANKCP